MPPARRPDQPRHRLGALRRRWPLGPDEELADGAYRLSVRSVAATESQPIVGLVETHRFEVDTVAPATPTIVSPTEDAK